MHEKYFYSSHVFFSHLIHITYDNGIIEHIDLIKIQLVPIVFNACDSIATCDKNQT